MIIQSKFKSVCPFCSKEIAVGENVEWSKGKKAAHPDCDKKEKELKKKEQNEKLAALKEAHDNAEWRPFDKIEVKVDLTHKGMFGNREEELIAPAGTKGKILGNEIRKVLINGIYTDCVQIEETVRKGSQPKTKRGIFLAPIDKIKIIKKAKF